MLQHKFLNENVQQTKHHSAYIQVWLYLGLMQFGIQNKFKTCFKTMETRIKLILITTNNIAINHFGFALVKVRAQIIIILKYICHTVTLDL